MNRTIIKLELLEPLKYEAFYEPFGVDADSWLVREIVGLKKIKGIPTNYVEGGLTSIKKIKQYERCFLFNFIFIKFF